MLWAEVIKVFFCFSSAEKLQWQEWRLLVDKRRHRLPLGGAWFWGESKCVTDMSTCFVSSNDNNDDYDRISGGEWTLSSRSCRSRPSWKPPRKEFSGRKVDFDLTFFCLSSLRTMETFSHTHAYCLQTTSAESPGSHFTTLNRAKASKMKTSRSLRLRHSSHRSHERPTHPHPLASRSFKCAVKRLSFSLAAECTRKRVFLRWSCKIKKDTKRIFFIYPEKVERANDKKYSRRDDPETTLCPSSGQKCFNRILNMTETRTFMDERIVLCI